MAANDIIQIHHVNFYYGAVRALTDISMQFEKNKVTALIGPSGCGKSTLLRLLNRMNDLIDQTRVEGEILFEGRNIYAPQVDPVEIRRKIGMVFQKPNPFPKTIYNNITYGPKLNGVPAADLPGLVEQSLRQAVLWDEGHPRQIRHESFGRSAAATVHCTRSGDETGCFIDGRADVGAGSDFNGENRRTRRRTEAALHDHHRDPQHAAGGAHFRSNRFLLSGEFD
jgi:ABC-type sugar transport system ATPase subunit